MKVTVWLSLRPTYNQYTKKREGVAVRCYGTKPVDAVTPETVIFEMNLNIDDAVLEYPTLNVDIKSAPIDSKVIVAELKEWVGE
jgi:hypothetical protein